MKRMLDVIWELEEGPAPQLDDFIDWHQAGLLMHGCYDIFRKGQDRCATLEAGLWLRSDGSDQSLGAGEGLTATSITTTTNIITVITDGGHHDKDEVDNSSRVRNNSYDVEDGVNSNVTPNNMSALYLTTVEASATAPETMRTSAMSTPVTKTTSSILKKITTISPSPPSMVMATTITARDLRVVHVVFQRKNDCLTEDGRSPLVVTRRYKTNGFDTKLSPRSMDVHLIQN
ncbi:hypothetical protein CBR_g21790 [Chara braunii]|uniref:Uncharacterized protein n=1 Tax=Chara braunii TaxID=69332 RepID=A0A388JUI8_CHABU|nr:hypothetical protein CBR_g21790 [Chara braunii]|eukprot:GBG61445.1 hypothetical protein CBR_g21790 [Chara braunii]